MKNLIFIIIATLQISAFGQSNSPKIGSLISITNNHQQEVQRLKEHINISTKLSKTRRIGTCVQLLGLIQTTTSLFSIYSYEKAFLDNPVLASATTDRKDRVKSMRNAAIGTLIASIGLTISLTSRDRANTKIHRPTKYRNRYSKFNNVVAEKTGINR